MFISLISEPAVAQVVTAATTVSFQQGVGGYTSTLDTFLAESAPTTTHGSLTSVGWDSDDPSGSGNDSIALIRFDNIFGASAGQIPAGSTILSARLSLFMSMTIAADVDVSLHRVISDWGEGTSDALDKEGKGAAATPGDATWLHTFAPSDLWRDVGGDFISLASAVSIVNDVGIYRWKANDMTVLDVQGWLDAPSTNFGWIVRGDESTNTTAKRFNSRENPDAATRPTLEIVYAAADELIFFDRFESGNTSSWSQTWP